MRIGLLGAQSDCCKAKKVGLYFWLLTRALFLLLEPLLAKKPHGRDLSETGRKVAACAKTLTLRAVDSINT